MQIKEYQARHDVGFHKGFPSPRLFWCLAFVYASLLALMFQKLVLPLMPEMHAGFGLLKKDAFWFHTQAVAIAGQINAHGWSEWKMYPTDATGNVALLSAVYAVFGPNPAFFIPINAAAHATGAMLIYMIGPLLWRGRVGVLGGLIAATLFILFPSALQWYGQNHKDSFSIAGTLLMLYAWMRIESGEKLAPKQLLLMLVAGLAGALLLTMVRPYMATVVAVAFTLPWCALALWSILTRRLKLDRLKLIQTLVLLCLISGVAALSTTIEAPSSKSAFGEVGTGPVALASTALHWKDIKLTPPNSGGLVSTSSHWDGFKFIAQKLDQAANWEGFKFIPQKLDQAAKRATQLRLHFVTFSKSVSAGSSIDTDILPSSLGEVVAYMPRALVIGFFAPFPSSWTQRVSAPRLAGAIETSVWYVFFIGLAVLAYRRPSRALFSGLIFAAFIIAVLSFVQPNVGNLYRQRFGLWMFVLLCGAVGWASIALPFFSRAASPPANVPHDVANHHLTIGSSSSVAASGSVVIMITFLCYLGFMARDILLASTIGISSRLDAFFSASMIPMFFVTFLSMPLADAMMLPFFKAGPKQIESTARNILWLAAVVLGSATVLIAAFAGQLVNLVLKDLGTAELTEAAGMLRLFAPIVLLSAWTVVGNAVLNALHRSREGAMAQMVVPAVTLMAIVLLPRESGIHAAIGGMLLGTFINVILVVLCAQRAGILLWPSKPESLSTLGSVVKNYRLLAMAAVFTAALNPMNFMFAGTVGVGTVSAWALSSKIVLLFNGLASIGISAVLLPHFARLITLRGIADLRHHVYFLLIAGSWIGGATALAIFEFADPLANVLFSGNQTSRNRIEDIANVIRTGALQIPILIAAAVIAKMAAVSGTSSKALIAAMLGLAINLFFNLMFVPRLGVLGIALGALMGTAISTAYLAIATREICGFTMKEVFILIISWIGWASACVALIFKSEVIMACAIFGLAILGWTQWKIAQSSPA